MRALVVACVVVLCSACTQALRINQIQFIGSHNSYKQAMPAEFADTLRTRNPQAADALAYSHIPIPEQLDLGIRKLEIDVFYDAATNTFPVGHVQVIDMNSHCPHLRQCLAMIRQWSADHPRHIPIWISFNAKDQHIEGLPVPDEFTAKVLMAMDTVIMDELAGQLVTPADVLGRNWPKLSTARGKFLLILDEGGDKRDHYLNNWRARPMFALAPEDHPAAAVMVINDPLRHGSEISRLVKAGYLVRTRADADTVEARSNDTRRREAAFASGAHAISTDYYLPANHFGNDYQVRFLEVVRCNPKTTSSNCRVEE